MPDLEPGTETFLTLRFTLDEETPWCKAGHEIAAAQFPIHFPTAAGRPADVSKLPPLALEETAVTVTVSGGGGHAWQLVFDKTRGRIVSWQQDGVELIAVGPALNLWRAATDNDVAHVGAGPDGERYHLLDEWLKAGLHNLQHEVDEITIEQLNPQRIDIHVRARVAPAAIEFEQKLTVLGSGELLLQTEIETGQGLPLLPRIGLTMMLPAGFEALSWYGRGPFENYRDRSSGALSGLYQSTVSEQYVPYIVPQEHGNRSDVRWVALANEEGTGLLASGMPLMEMSAGHYTAQDLYEAAHTNELTPRAETILNLDHRQMGLGSASCGPATLPAYLIPPGVYQFSVRLRPFTKEDPAPGQLARSPLPDGV